MKEQEAVERLKELAKAIQDTRDYRIGVNQFDVEAITTVLDALEIVHKHFYVSEQDIEDVQSS